MKKQFIAILLFLFIGSLLGCATNLTRHQCLEADWYEIGFIDGREGEPRSKFQEHAESCSQYNVSVGREAYYRGRDQGLKIYCTQDKGFDLGILGEKYNHICPQELESNFLAGYNKGQKANNSRSKISTLEQRLQLIETQIQSKKKQLLASDLSQDRKAEIQADIKYLNVEYSHTDKKLKELKNEISSD